MRVGSQPHLQVFDQGFLSCGHCHRFLESLCVNSHLHISLFSHQVIGFCKKRRVQLSKKYQLKANMASETGRIIASLISGVVHKIQTCLGKNIYGHLRTSYEHHCKVFLGSANHSINLRYHGQARFFVNKISAKNNILLPEANVVKLFCP